MSDSREAVTSRQWHRIRIDGEHTIASILYQPAICSCGESWDEASVAIGHAYSANAILEDELRTAAEELCGALALWGPWRPGQPPEQIASAWERVAEVLNG